MGYPVHVYLYGHPVRAWAAHTRMGCPYVYRMGLLSFQFMHDFSLFLHKNLIQHYSSKLAIQLYASVAPSMMQCACMPVCGGSVGLRPATWIPFSMIGNYAGTEPEKTG